MIKFIKRIWKWLTFDEGMTWERYHRNMKEMEKEVVKQETSEFKERGSQ